MNRIKKFWRVEKYHKGMETRQQGREWDVVRCCYYNGMLVEDLMREVVFDWCLNDGEDLAMKWSQQQGTMTSIGPLRVKDRNATEMQISSWLDVQVKMWLSWRCFQRKFKPMWHQRRWSTELLPIMAQKPPPHCIAALDASLPQVTPSPSHFCSLAWCSNWECNDTHKQSGLWAGECVFPNFARAGSQVLGSKYVTRCLWSGRGVEACSRRRRGSLLVRRPEASSRRLCGRLGLCKELWLSFWESRWGKTLFESWIKNLKIWVFTLFLPPAHCAILAKSFFFFLSGPVLL